MESFDVGRQEIFSMRRCIYGVLEACIFRGLSNFAPKSSWNGVMKLGQLDTDSVVERRII